MTDTAEEAQQLGAKSDLMLAYLEKLTPVSVLTGAGEVISCSLSELDKVLARLKAERKRG